MRVVVAGHTGFIGRQLCAHLKDLGHDVIGISRRADPKMPNSLNWDTLEQVGLPPCDAVINLCGANIMGKRWTPKYKEELIRSRVETCERLNAAIHAAVKPPEVFICASAIGYYPIGTELSCDEDDSPGKGFMSELCKLWEKAARQPLPPRTRTAIVRIGVVLGTQGGALSRMLLPFKLGLGGPLGSGTQPFSWIHIDDLLDLFVHLMSSPLASGVFNGVAPGVVDNASFTKILAKHLGRPAFFWVPAPLLKLVLGEVSQVLLEGCKVVPKHTQASGFIFRYPTLERALDQLLPH